MISTMQSIDNLLNPLRKLSNMVAVPLYDLGIRVFVALVFFKSGMLRFQDHLNGSWDNQLYVFEYEHPVPGIPAEISSVMATGGELVLPILLILGLFGRFAAAGLLIMTLIIELTYQSSLHHTLYFFLLGSTFLRGPGCLSVDALMLKMIRKQTSENETSSQD